MPPATPASYVAVLPGRSNKEFSLQPTRAILRPLHHWGQAAWPEWENTFAEPSPAAEALFEDVRLLVGLGRERVHMCAGVFERGKQVLRMLAFGSGQSLFWFDFQ